ncbi:MAG: nickel-binding protein [Nitrososphaeraceae archaeon]
MPVFLDVHSFGTATEEELINAQNAPRDDLGVKVANILYNLEGGAIYCILDAPDKKAVEKHHSFLGLICDTSVDVLILLSSPWAWDVSLICTVAIYSF